MSLLFELKDIELCVSLPYNPTLQGIDLAQLTATSKTILEAKQHQDRRDNQTNTKIEVSKLSSTNFEDFELSCSGTACRKTECMGFPSTTSSGTNMWVYMIPNGRVDKRSLITASDSMVKHLSKMLKSCTLFWCSTLAP